MGMRDFAYAVTAAIVVSLIASIIIIAVAQY